MSVARGKGEQRPRVGSAQRGRQLGLTKGGGGRAGLGGALSLSMWDRAGQAALWACGGKRMG